MTEGSDPLYPNRAREGPPVDRRRFLAGSAAVGAAAASGCSSDDGGGEGDGADETATARLTEAPTVLVFNTGDRTVSVIDVEDDDVVATVGIGVTSSFPSNQYTPGLVDSRDEHFWANVGRGVRALSASDLGETAVVETGSGANWQERTPDGDALVVSAREPAHTQFKVDADPGSEAFGEVLAELDRTDEGGRGDTDGPGPCDVSIHPDGRYAYVPDLFGDTLTVLDVEAFELVRQVDVAPVGEGGAKPWMATVAPDGERMLVEHNEGTNGTESVWDLSDPAEPTELARLTTDDGLGRRPLTSEVSPDGTGFVCTPGTDDLTVVDLLSQTVETRVDVGGDAFAATWDPDREKLYVPVQTDDSVAVVDPVARAVTATIPVGAKPYGATAAKVRPEPDERGTTAGALARLGLAAPGTTYCIGNCACGHEL